MERILLYRWLILLLYFLGSCIIITSVERWLFLRSKSQMCFGRRYGEDRSLLKKNMDVKLKKLGPVGYLPMYGILHMTHLRNSRKMTRQRRPLACYGSLQLAQLAQSFDFTHEEANSKRTGTCRVSTYNLMVSSTYNTGNNTQLQLIIWLISRDNTGTTHNSN